MKYEKHHLGNVACPLNRDWYCESNCAWFDHEIQDCRMIGVFWKIVEAIRDNERE